jgi:hypothetical protein
MDRPGIDLRPLRTIAGAGNGSALNSGGAGMNSSSETSWVTSGTAASRVGGVSSCTAAPGIASNARGSSGASSNSSRSCTACGEIADATASAAGGAAGVSWDAGASVSSSAASEGMEVVERPAGFMITARRCMMARTAGVEVRSWAPSLIDLTSASTITTATALPEGERTGRNRA